MPLCVGPKARHWVTALDRIGLYMVSIVADFSQKSKKTGRNKYKPVSFLRLPRTAFGNALF